MDQYKINKLLNYPMYRKYIETKNLNKKNKLEKNVEQVIEVHINEGDILSKEIRRKSILYRLHQKIDVLKNIMLTQRSKEWADLYQWLMKFHKQNVDACLTKDIFTDDAQLYLWGGSDVDGLKKDEHFNLVKKIYHSIQYGQHDTFINIGHTFIQPDQAEIRIKEIVKAFNQALVKNEVIKIKFINFIKHFDLHSFVCTPQFEKFFLNWWDYAYYLVKEKSNYLNIDDLEKEVNEDLHFFSESLEPLNLQPRLHRRHLNFSNGYDYLDEPKDTELYLTLDLPVRSQIPIEDVVNGYLHGLQQYFAMYAQQNHDYQQRVIEISNLQQQFQTMKNQKIKSIDATDLNSQVVEILYLKWSYGQEAAYSPLAFLKEVVSFFEKESDQLIAHNLNQIAELKDLDSAKIWIKAADQDLIYDFSVGSIRKKLERSLKKF